MTYSFPRMYALQVELSVDVLYEWRSVVTHGTMFAVLPGATSEIINPAIAATAKWNVSHR